MAGPGYLTYMMISLSHMNEGIEALMIAFGKKVSYRDKTKEEKWELLNYYTVKAAEKRSDQKAFGEKILTVYAAIMHADDWNIIYKEMGIKSLG